MRISGKIKRLGKGFNTHHIMAGFMSALLIISTVLGAITPIAAFAAENDSATSDSVTIGDATQYSESTGMYNVGHTGANVYSHRFTNTDGITMYCADYLYGTPSAGETFTGAESGGLTLDYLLYYGFGGPAYDDAQGIVGYTGEEAQAVTQLAVWAALDGGETLDGYNDHLYETRRLFSAAQQFLAQAAGASSDAVYAGGSYIYGSTPSIRGDLQRVIGFTLRVGDIKLHKSSSNPSVTNDNDCYSLGGAEFAVTDDLTGKNVGTLVTDDNGDSNSLEVPAGTYTVRETKAPKGYTLDDTPKNVTVTPGQSTTVTFVDAPGMDPMYMLVGKYDGEKAYNDSANLPQGAASLTGAEFTVKYYDTLDYDSYDDLAKSDEQPTRSWVVRTADDGFAILDESYLVSGDALYHSASGDVQLPRGTVVVYESKAPTGYKVSSDVSFQKIQEEPSSELVTYNAPEVAESIYRSDLEFTKKADDSGDRLANVAFVVTSQTTGESHVVVTDENGFFSSASSWNAHTKDTNGNDWALDEDGVIDSAKLDDAAGVWFGGTPADDALGALSYDTYTIRELRCTANEGYQLIDTAVTISRDGQCYDFGTLDDQKASIHTNAYDADDNDKYVGVGEVSVADKVTYSNVIAGRPYTLVAELHDAKTGEAILDADGNAVTVERDFTPTATNGFEVVNFNVSTYDLGGSTVVVYERLYDADGSLLADHSDKTDVDQQVTVVEPVVHTTATDAADGDKTAFTDDEMAITDTVAYGNLIPGKEYTVTGTLHVKRTDADGNVSEEALTVDGSPVTAQTTFVPTASDGTVDVTFTFDSLRLPDDTQLVAFETLELGGHEVAVHADVNDMDQTVTVETPTIGTTATDGLDGDKTVVADDSVTITDEVSYASALSDTTYTMVGILMDADTGLPILTGEGSEKYTDEQLSSFMDNLRDVFGQPSDDTGTLPTTVDMTALTTLMEDNADLVSHMVRQSEVFTPESYDGTLPMDFTFEANDVIDRLSGETKNIVVFEAMVKGTLDEDAPTVVAAEFDLTNEGQTVKLVPSEIGTTATDKTDGDHELLASTDSIIVDTVDYEGLLPGKEYTLKATLYDKATGEPLLVNDKKVTAELRFTPNSEDGTVEIELGEFDTSTLADHDLVVFEELYKQGVNVDGSISDTLVAQHKDINDEGQTVIVTNGPKGTTHESPTGTPYAKTGGSDVLLYFALAALVVLACGAGWYAHKNRARKGDDKADSDVEESENSKK